MTKFALWCNPERTNPVGSHSIGILSSVDDDVGIALLADLLPSQYADPDNFAKIAERLSKPLVANYLREIFPQKQRTRSGDLGEILASCYLSEQLGFVIGSSRLIHRDHREWAMRGDDILGAKFDSNSSVLIAKGEAKSRATMRSSVIADARAGLQRSEGMPSPHSLIHFATQLLDTSEDALGEAVLQLQLSQGLRPDSVTHLMFLFAGNDPSNEVQLDLIAYAGSIRQLTRIVQPQAHQDFIRAVYERAIANAT